MIELKNGLAKYTINPFRGAATCEWKIDGKDILYIEPKSYAQANLKFKGGNPVIFPNFSTLALDGGTQINYDGHDLNLLQHGLARLSSRWRANLETEASAKLYLSHDDESLKAFPYPFEMEVEFILFEDGLRLSQKIHNSGSTPLPFVAAFHPYFSISDPKHCEVSGYLPGTPCYALPNAGPFDFSAHMPKNLPFGQVEINHHMVTGSRKITLKDRLSSRTISIHPSGAYPCLTIWSEPGQPFVCMEPTSGRRGAFETRENLIRLPAGQTWEGKLEIRVECL